MTGPEIEEAVAEFLDRRAHEPELTPESFAARRGDAAARVLAAIRTALEIETLFPDEAAPRAIGPYRITGEIGRGGMGIVYAAEAGDARYAIKVLPLAPILGPRLLERFRRETEALGQISHPNIVRVHGSGMHEGMPYLVMDHVAGRALQDAGPDLTTAAGAELIETLARAIDAAHRQGVLHRDLKPQNVIVRADGAPVLVDFGLSVADDMPTLTATGEIVGTPRYMAPEQLTGAGEDARTDVYALGLMLYELVLKQPARAGVTRETLLDHVRRGRVPRPRAVRRDTPRAMERILLTALARDPARRYASAAALADDLGRFRRGEPVVARPPARWVGWVEAARDRPGGIWAPAAAAVLVALLAGLWFQGAASERARLRAGAHVTRALTHWLDGDSVAARARLDAALRLDPANATARLLAAQGGGDPGRLETPCLRAAHEGLAGFDRGAFGAAIEAMRECESGELDPALVSAVIGLAAAGSDSLALAADELAAAVRALPGSARLQRALGSVSDRLLRYDDALRAYEASLALTREPAAAWADIAEVHLHRRDLPAGLVAIRRADSMAAAEDPRILRLRARLEVHSGLHADGQRRLARLLELNPADVDAHFQMGYSFDTEHRIVEAERAYRSAATLDPMRGDALVCLANLHAGGSRGQCRGCDSAYAAHPHLHDLAKAERYVLRAFEADLGRQSWVTQSARDIALKLPQRDSVIALLERLIAGRPRDAGVLQLEEVLRRLRLVES